MRISNLILVPAGTATNANLNSTPQQVQMVFGYAVQAIFTGAPTGTIKLQASNDPVLNVSEPDVVAPSHWTDIANSSFTVSASGTVMWNVQSVNYTWFRVVYTDTSGGTSTATMEIISNIKGF